MTLMAKESGGGSSSGMKTFSVLIPALNEEKNIGNLLDDILGQDLGQSLVLEKVIVVSDCSTDGTEQLVNDRSSADSRISMIVNRRTVGKPESINRGISNSSSDFLVLLDGDVRLNGCDVLRELLDGIGPDVGLIGGNPVPASGRSNLASSLSRCGDYLRNAIKMRIRNGDTLYSAHGRILALSRGLYSSVRLPFDEDPTKGLVPEDQFLYMACLQHGMRFELRNNAEVLFRLPTSLGDYIRQGTRFVFSMSTTSALFDADLAHRAYHIPFRVKVAAILDCFRNTPLTTVLWILFQLYGRLVLLFRMYVSKKSIHSAWDVCETTKDRVEID
jgi:glycosyltransferase involved in cell wall biosynthesis